eukprot:1021372-Heterocapsa_arctica.AAC.1
MCTRQGYFAQQMRASRKRCWSVVLKLKTCLSSSDVVQNDQRSARNRMVIGRMSEDRSNTF